ncbi:uncharacterized protein LOC144145601 isoform X5 [Haemaphysalis longicornis]
MTITITTGPAEEPAESDEEFTEIPVTIEMGIGAEPCNPPVAIKEEPLDIPVAPTEDAGEPCNPPVAIKVEPLDIPAVPTEDAGEADEILGITGIEALVLASKCRAKQDAVEACSTCLP